jgi:hypothetical protein
MLAAAAKGHSMDIVVLGVAHECSRHCQGLAGGIGCWQRQRSELCFDSQQYGLTCYGQMTTVSSLFWDGQALWGGTRGQD